MSRTLIFAGLALAVAPMLPAQSAPATSEISFKSDVTLSGTLVIPEGKGPFPAIVFIHGSGPMTREGFAPYAMEYARMGVASLMFDKRGAGKSGPGPETLEGMAGDAIAAVELLEKRKDIDSRRVGYWGISQAGWVISRAMAQSSDPDFAIVISGGGASPLESELFTWENEFAKHDLTGATLESARKLVRDYYAYFGGQVTRRQLLGEMTSAKDSGGALKELAGFLDSKLVPEGEESLAAWVHDYDPSGDIKRITDPMLILLGERDMDHPTPASAKAWRSGLASAGNKDVTIVVFPGAGHGIRMKEGFEGKGRAPFADGYKELIDGWLWRHVVAPPPPGAN